MPRTGPRSRSGTETEEDEVDMTGDIVLKVLKISGSRCAHSNSARPGPNRELTVDRVSLGAADSR